MAGEPERVFCVAFSKNGWRVSSSVKNFAHKHLDEGSLFFDYNNGVETSSEFADAAGFKGPDNSWFVELYPALFEGGFVKTHSIQRFTEVVISLPGCYEAYPGVGGSSAYGVELVETSECVGCLHSTFMNFQFLTDGEGSK